VRISRSSPPLLSLLAPTPAPPRLSRANHPAPLTPRRFASDIIIRGFDTPFKYVDERFENFSYAGVVTLMMQPILPVFFFIQFNFLYDGVGAGPQEWARFTLRGLSPASAVGRWSWRGGRAGRTRGRLALRRRGIRGARGDLRELPGFVLVNLVLKNVLCLPRPVFRTAVVKQFFFFCFAILSNLCEETILKVRPSPAQSWELWLSLVVRRIGVSWSLSPLVCHRFVPSPAYSS